MWDPRTGTGTVEAVKGQYTDAEGKCRVEALLFEEFGAMSAGVEELLMRVAKVAGRKLTWWQYDQTSWSAREWMPFALQRLSVGLSTVFRKTKRKTEGPQHFAFPEISRENRGCLVLHSGNSRVSLSLRAGLGQNLRQN